MVQQGLIRSRYSQVWQPDQTADRWFVFSGHTGTLYTGDSELAEALAEGSYAEIPENYLRVLRSALFLVPRGTDEVKLTQYMASQAAFRNTSLPFSMVLCPTLACNFACTFCFEDSQDDTRCMTSEVMDWLMAVVDRELPRRSSLSVTWYGGEPLLALEVVRNLSPRLRASADRLGKKYHAGMITNGYLLTQDLFRELTCQHGISFYQITLLGTKEQHDRQRALRGGQPTFERLVANLRLMAATDIEVRIVVRIHVDRQTVAYVGELVEELRSFLDSRFTLVTAPTRPFGQFAESDALTEGAAEAPLLTDEFFNPATNRGLGRLAEELFPTPFAAVCGAARSDGYIVGPGGELYTCWEGVGKAEYEVGDIRSGVEPTSVLRWYQAGIPKGCEDCDVLPLCFGGCADYQRRGTRLCWAVKENLRRRVELYDRFKKSTHRPAEQAATDCPSGG